MLELISLAKRTGLRWRVGGESHAVTVTGEVILAAGTIGSPQILELSGIRIARRIVAAPAFDGYRGEETVPGAHLWDERSLTDHLRASADASVMPAMVSGNTRGATMMIAENGAAMIRKEAATRPSQAICTGALAGGR